MISIKKFRDDSQKIKKAIFNRGSKVDISKVVSLDENVRGLKHKTNMIRSQINELSEKIGNAKKNKLDANNEINKSRKLGKKLKIIDLELKRAQNLLLDILYNIPNIAHYSVPIGKDESDNQIVRYWGKKPEFQFEVKDHTVLGKNLKLFDFKSGAKLSGTGFPVYTDRGALLERNLINSMINHHVTKFGFKEISPPVLMNKKSMITTGQLPKFEDDMYHTESDNLYLAPTAEVPLTNIHRDEILDKKQLPINYVAYTPCFRREAGSYGKETHGLLRLHQFNKVELVKFTLPEYSYSELEVLTKQAETILQTLGLHYRVIELCTGDLSFSAAKCYDIEVWAPGEEKWLEVSSCSNFESFQSRRGNIRFRDKIENNVDFLHTLNGSGLATPRLMVALLETYQTGTGNIEFPPDVSEFLQFQEKI